MTISPKDVRQCIVDLCAMTGLLEVDASDTVLIADGKGTPYTVNANGNKINISIFNEPIKNRNNALLNPFAEYIGTSATDPASIKFYEAVFNGVSSALIKLLLTAAMYEVNAKDNPDETKSIDAKALKLLTLIADASDTKFINEIKKLMDINNLSKIIKLTYSSKNLSTSVAMEILTDPSIGESIGMRVKSVNALKKAICLIFDMKDTTQDSIKHKLSELGTKAEQGEPSKLSSVFRTVLKIYQCINDYVIGFSPDDEETDVIDIGLLQHHIDRFKDYTKIAKHVHPNVTNNSATAGGTNSIMSGAGIGIGQVLSPTGTPLANNLQGTIPVAGINNVYQYGQSQAYQHQQGYQPSNMVYVQEQALDGLGRPVFDHSGNPILIRRAVDQSMQYGVYNGQQQAYQNNGGWVPMQNVLGNVNQQPFNDGLNQFSGIFGRR